MNELEDKDFSWSLGYAWRTTIKMLVIRWPVVLLTMVVTMFCFHWLVGGLTENTSSIDRNDLALPLFFGAIGGYFYMQKIVNKSGLNAICVWLAGVIFIAIVLAITLGVLHLLGADGKYQAVALTCAGSIAVGGLIILKDQA